MKLKGAAGLIDAGSSSLANFLLGLVAVRSMQATDLALYSLLFMGAVLAMRVPQQVGLFPYRIQLNLHQTKFRPDYGQSLRLALPGYAIATPLIFLTGLPVAGQNSLGNFLWAALGASLWCIVSSFQDHVRMSLHGSEMHWAAAVVSVVNCALIGLIILGAAVLPGPDWAEPVAPFAALIVTNLISALVGMKISLALPRFRGFPSGSMLSRSKYLVSDLVILGSGYLASAVVGIFLGVAAVASLEATRIAAQPVFILATAVGSVVTPLVVRAYGRRDFTRVKRLVNLMTAGSVLLGALYSVGVWAAAGLLSVAIGRHFDAPLAAARSAASAVQTVGANVNSLYYVSENTARLNLLSIISSAVSLVALAVALPLVGVYAVPICLAVAAGIRFFFSQYDLRHRLIGGSPASVG